MAFRSIRSGQPKFIVGAKPRGIDLGEVNGHLFFNVASIGFSAELARDLTASAKRRWGTLGYGIAAARLLSRSRLFSAEFDHDGITETIRTLQISVGNGRHYGGGMTVEATARPTDGKLDFYSLEVDHWWRLLRLLPSLRRGTQSQWDDVRGLPDDRSHDPDQTTASREYRRRVDDINTAHFRIRPKAIQVFAPPPLNSAIPKAVETLTPSASRP